MVKNSLKCCPYKIIFMDLNMPIMDGFQSSRKIVKLLEEHNKQPKNLEQYNKSLAKSNDYVKILMVACTANDYQNEWERCRKVGLTRFLSKPPPANELRKLLTDVFGAERSPNLIQK